MGKKINKKLNYLFAAIGGVVLFGAWYSFFSHEAAFFFVVICTHGITAFWLQRDPMEKVLSGVRWAAGILASIAVFDGAMRLMRHGSWMRDNASAFTLDGIFVVLFLLWAGISFFINRHKRQRSIHDFC